MTDRVKWRQPYDPTQSMDAKENLAASISQHHGAVDKMNRQAAYLIAATVSGCIEQTETVEIGELDDYIKGLLFSLQTGTPREGLAWDSRVSLALNVWG